MKSKVPVYSERAEVDCKGFGGGWFSVGRGSGEAVEEDVVGSGVVVVWVVAAVGVEEDIL
jgi:hypothetical protein